MNQNICTVDGCEEEAKVKGFCLIHYNRMWRHGSSENSKTKREKLIEEGLSYCPKCKKEKEISEFNKDKHTAFGIAIYCRKCNKTKANVRYKNFKSEHRNTQLKSDYNITLDEYNEMLTKQNNGCVICGKTINGKRKMCVDHDHKTGKVRGLLCSQCNWGLGHFKDDVDLLEKAIKYLKS
jgi:hypothetical protein